MNSIDERLKRLQAKLSPNERPRPKSMYNDNGQIVAELVSNKRETIVGLTFKKELSGRQKREAYKLFEKQRTCGICAKLFKDGRDKHIDHCHVTGVVRGALCYNCNVGLGHFKDNSFILESALRYLADFKFNPDLIE